MDNLDNKKYPIGKFRQPESATDSEIDDYIETIKKFPVILRRAVQDLTDEMLDTQYRPEGWTVRQLIHHLADSHMQSFIRLKLALTEENPTIKPYDEARWAELQDSRNEPMKASLSILDGLHCRWVHILKTMTNRDFDRTFFHPEQNRAISLRENAAFYAWHCDHHFAQLTNLLKEKGWG